MPDKPRRRRRAQVPGSLREGGVALQVRCTKADRQRWKDTARERGRPLSDVVRELLDGWAAAPGDG